MRGLFDEGMSCFIVGTGCPFQLRGSQVNGENVYCKGAEIAAKAILGPIGEFSAIEAHPWNYPGVIITFQAL